jgi:ubiquinol-cytochrome c reductase cytochrome b subunit
MPPYPGEACSDIEAIMAVEKTLPASASAGEKALNWIDNRFPLSSTFKGHMSEYYAPKNFNFWYFFGSLALLVLVIQIVTGIFLVMHYKPDANLAFASVEYIMRDVPGGYLIRYMHSTGASAFFMVVYMHMFRGLIYGSYRKPRELVWVFGCMIFLCLMAEAFFGYLLPWGQMSYWGAQVIVNLFSAIPFIGPELSLWIRGDYVVGDATLNRFFSFHVIAIPLVLLGLVGSHIVALHEVGSNNPDGIDIKLNKDPKTGIPLDGIPFHPYYSVHDLMGVGVFLTAFSAVIFFAPEMGGYFLEYNNFVPADPLKTPAHIAPVWYFTPFYSILRAVTTDFLYLWAVPCLVVFLGLIWMTVKSIQTRIIGTLAVGGLIVGFLAPLIGLEMLSAKFWGVAAMGASTMILFSLPWIDNSPVRSIRYRPTWHWYIYAVFVIDFIVLGYLGVQPPSAGGTLIAMVGTILYFAFFLLMPWWSEKGEFKTVPDRVVFAAH